MVLLEYLGSLHTWAPLHVLSGTQLGRLRRWTTVCKWGPYQLGISPLTTPNVDPRCGLGGIGGTD
uniref:Uncharacterized protein n=1 Tax=Anopheles atroparvus TaxID=41427 RepID=A0AAG5DC84_ANOAO